MISKERRKRSLLRPILGQESTHGMMAESTSEDRSSPKAQSQDNPSEEAISNEKVVDASAKNPSFITRTWAKLGLNVGMLMLMVKGALPPTIAIAIYQSSPVAAVFSTLGYLVAIMAVLSFPILPRSKFIQTNILNVIGVCIGAAVALLEIYCSVQARAHTTQKPPASSNGPSPGAAVVGYNSSACAVCAIWLFFNIYIVNSLRASRPQLQFPAIMYSIFAVVASIYAPSFPTMAAGMSFAERLLEAFLAGIAIATAVSLFVFPMTVRMMFFKQSAGFIRAVQGTLKAQMSYLESLEKSDMFSDPGISQGESHNCKKTQIPQSTTKLETEKLKAAIQGLEGLHGKIYADLAFAKREMGWGKLDASDIAELFKLMQGIMLPLTGMGSAADIFQRAAIRLHWTDVDNADSHLQESEKVFAQETKREWNEIMKTLHDPFQAMTEAMVAGLEHTLFTLELAKPPRKSKNKKASSPASVDIEAKAGLFKPGDRGYAEHMEKKISDFYEKRKSTLAVYAQQKGVKLDVKSFDNVSQAATRIRAEIGPNDDETRQRNRRQLYLVLFMEFLLWSTGRSVLSLVQFADKKAEIGTMKKNRLILPTGRRLKKWFLSLLKKGADEGTEHTPDMCESGGASVYAGASFQAAKDPEHLPATNAWQRFGNGFRHVGGTLGSVESAFGFRVACATLSIGIVAFLADTRTFFLEQRLLWAMIMVSIGMTVTAGSGIFGFVGRVLGTVIAMCTSFIIWYIVDGKTAGVIVFLFVFIFVEFYFVLAYPRFVIIALLSVVTQVLIIGYELQVKKVGEQLATSNGQPFYEIYLLGPYRLACVAGGMLVAFIWTFFPYPLTARSQLRKDLGASLYLLANFYSIVHTTVGLRVRNAEGDMELKKSPGRKLEKARSEVYVKELTLLAGLRLHSCFTAWEPTLGGKFPKKQYDVIIQEINNILNYLMLISYSSKSLTHEPSASPDQKTWIDDFSLLIGSINATSQEITSTLALLSASITNGTPLPPYLKAPPAYNLSKKLEALDADILSISHITEPGYSAFAVMQIASSLVSDDLGKIIENVKELVGEVDFSFHVISTADSSEDTLLNKGKKD